MVLDSLILLLFAERMLIAIKKITGSAQQLSDVNITLWVQVQKVFRNNTKYWKFVDYNL